MKARALLVTHLSDWFPSSVFLSRVTCLQGCSWTLNFTKDFGGVVEQNCSVLSVYLVCICSGHHFYGLGIVFSDRWWRLSLVLVWTHGVGFVFLHCVNRMLCHILCQLYLGLFPLIPHPSMSTKHLPLSISRAEEEMVSSVWSRVICRDESLENGMCSALVATVGVGELGMASQEAALNCSLESTAVLFSGAMVNF